MQRTYKLYLISLLTLNSLCLSAEPIPLFDTHLHYNTDAVGQFDPQAVIQKLDSAGIEKVLVSSTDDSGTQELLKLAPSRVVPALRPYRQPGTIKTWMYDESVIEHLEILRNTPTSYLASSTHSSSISICRLYSAPLNWQKHII